MNYEQREKMKEAIWEAAKEGRIKSLMADRNYDGGEPRCVGMWAGRSISCWAGRPMPAAHEYDAVWTDWNAFQEVLCECTTLWDGHQDGCITLKVANLNDQLLQADPEAQEEVARRVCKLLDEHKLDEG